MKLRNKIFVLFIILFFTTILFSLWFFIFFKDPFIKIAPENTKIYGFINLNCKIKSSNINMFNIKNININKILENDIIKKIKLNYSSKISFSIDENNEVSIFLKQKMFKKNIYELDENLLSKEISKYLNVEVKLNKYKLNSYVILTTYKDVNHLLDNKYEFFISNYKKNILDKNIRYFLYDNFIKIYSDSFYVNNIIKNNNNSFFNNYFSKEYFNIFASVDFDNINIDITNIKNNKTILNNYYLKSDSDNYLNINNINSYYFLSSFFNKYKEKNISSSENINYFLKNLKESGFSEKDIEKIFSNNSNIFLSFKNSNLSLDNLDNYLVFIELKNFSNYLEVIKNLENSILRNIYPIKPILKNVVLPDGSIAKEELIDYSESYFKTKENSFNGINYLLKYVEIENNKFYYSMLDNGVLLFTNNENNLKMINSYENNNLFELKLFNLLILAKFNENNLNITIK